MVDFSSVDDLEVPPIPFYQPGIQTAIFVHELQNPCRPSPRGAVVFVPARSIVETSYAISFNPLSSNNKKVDTLRYFGIYGI